MVENTFSTERETDNQWKHIRRTEKAIRELRDLRAFIQGIQFVGKRLPITIGDDSMQHMEMLLTAPAQIAVRQLQIKRSTRRMRCR